MDIDKKQEGRAYAFISSSASESEIKEYLPLARERAHTPDSLEFRFHKDIFPLEHLMSIQVRPADSELFKLAQSALDMGNNYTMEAYLPNATNERTAGELGDLLNEFYQSPLQKKFLREDGKYWGGIVYKEGEEYVFKE